MLQSGHSRWTTFTGLFILLFIVIGLINIGDYGMGWDEVTRWNSGDLKVDYYKAVVSGENGDWEQRMRGDRYPGLFDMSLSLIHRLAGGNRMLQGHVLSLLFGALGLAATAWLATIAFGHRVAFFATLLLALLPNFYGHAMINPKDIPFLSAYTLGLAVILHVAKGIWSEKRIRKRDAALAGLAVGLAGATRVPGMVLWLLAAASWVTAYAWSVRHARIRLKESNLVPNLLVALALSAGIAFLVLLVFFPRLHFQLFSGIARVSNSLHSSASEIPLLYKGEVMDASEGPATYAHYMFLITTPVWMLLLLAAGFIDIATRSIRPADREPGFLLRSGLFILLAAFPWIYVLLTNPALHNGIRHMLWAVPPLMVIAAQGICGIYDWIIRKEPRLRWGAPALLLCFLVFQGIQLYRSHPYQYVYFNFLAGEKQSVVNRYEGEYWFTSTRHLLEALPRVVEVAPTRSEPVKLRVAGPLNSAYPFIPEGFVLTNNFSEAEYFVSNTTFRTDLLAEGEVVYRITSNGIPIGVITRLNPTNQAEGTDARPD